MSLHMVAPAILSGGSNGFESSTVTCLFGIMLALVLLHYSKGITGLPLGKKS